MASKTAPRPSPRQRPASKPVPPGLSAALAERMAAALLPAEAADFAAPDLADAAGFALGALLERAEDEPAILIDSVLGERRFLRIALVNDDRPFLVDSVSAAISALGVAIHRLVHPVLATSRDEAGRLTALVDGETPGARRESLIYLETDRADARARRDLADALATTLGDVQAAVADWPRMQGAMLVDAARVADADGAELLRWLAGGMLTQLGHVVRRREGSQSGALGVCRKSARRLLAPESWDRAFAHFDAALAGAAAIAPLAIKANLTATVHRRVPYDLFLIPVIEDGAVAAISAHAGVWTSAALATAPDKVPLLARRLADLTAQYGFAPSSHAGKALFHALTVLPHDLLIGFAPADLDRVATTMMSQVDRPRPSLVLVRAALDRHLYAFVWLPRDALSTRARLEIMDLLAREADGTVIDWTLAVDGGNLAMLRFVLDIRDSTALPDEAELDARLSAMVRGWPQALEAELALGEDPARAAALAARYAEAFPVDYRTLRGAAEAAADISVLRQLSGETRAARLVCGADGALRLKLYQREGAMVLSDAVPVLENFGFRVIDETPVALDGGRLGTLHDFRLEPPAEATVEALQARAGVIEAALAAVLNGAGEDDGFNRLITGAGLAAHEANWLRAWFRYLRQAGLGFSLDTVVEALRGAGAVTRGLLDGFVARHDPAFAGDREAAFGAAQEAIRAALAGVASINHDRVLRAFQALLGAVLRTNAFAPAGAEALAFKLDSALVPGLPRPLPWREISVYSARVEGIHLRAGPVARGGLRWSDRRDDFRTEVLGLMKAQRVKNAVIVPTGAKGGFYPKRLPDPVRARDAWLAEGRASYQVFIRTLLSITDNIVDGAVVHPADVVIRDGEDPYFVVAADKGTATFSDTANAIAEDHGFWLDDAFASGGSKGYDHKAMGITARGAWLSVQRHFLELGVDVQADPVRVVGVGDMSGDVFGNGMLLSQSLKLVAAFDHRHIFLDPEPDPAKSHAERARLFALPRSSWDDYDKALISPGGGVFARSLKSIPLSPQVRAALDIAEESLDPEALLAAILRAPVDLLWFGGIGTYVKAAAEVNAAVGDPANDAVRVNAEDLRVRVIGEGANLGCTQAGRIAFSLASQPGRSGGGRINTDFIDNSAGVDCSDNEVNIKIALASAKRAGRLSEKARVALLVSMTDAVAAHVLEDNRLQALALSIAEARGPAATPGWVRLMDQMAESGDLDRRTEGLADNDALMRRAAGGMGADAAHGLTRPELAVLLSSAKLVLQRAIEGSALPDDPGLTDDLFAAFPAPMRGRFRKDILAHRLRREIIATRLANRIVNRMGPARPFELAEEEGAGLDQVAGAFVAAERLFALAPLWQALEEAAMPEAARLLLFDRTASALEGHMADLLRVGAGASQPTALAAQLAPAVATLSATVGTLLPDEARTHSTSLRADFAAAAAPEDASGMVAHLFDMDGAAGLAALAQSARRDPAALTEAFTALGARLGLDWAQHAARRMTPPDPWERLLAKGLARDFQHMRLDFLRRNGTGKLAPLAACEAWAAANHSDIARFAALIARARNSGAVTPVMLAQVAGQARVLLGR